MIIERDVAVPCDDGTVLRADVFRPDDGAPKPVIMTLGPYGKGVRYEDGYAPQWNWLVTTYPDVLPGSNRAFMTWETVDPEIWVPWGYVVVRVDSRGAGRSPGRLDIFSPREVRDYYDAIEWAGVQRWSNGKVGLNGISYYAINQWLVAALQPPHLAAMIPWEGAADFYRDWARHGGIMSNAFLEVWYPRQVVSVQHGNPTGHTDPWLGEPATGPEKLTDDELEANRSDPVRDILDHPLDGPFYRDRSPDWSKVTVPFLSAANVAGYGLHPRGNFEAFTQAASSRKWLEAHPGRHEEWFYLERSMALQKRFLDHFLKGEDNGWDGEPPVLLHVRRPFSDEVEPRTETQWPLHDTQWTPIYLSATDTALAWDSPSPRESVTFDALGEPVTFLSAPLSEETELTGPLAATLYVSSSTTDADLFVTLQAFAPDGREVDFQGTIDPHTPLAQGWLRGVPPQDRPGLQQALPPVPQPRRAPAARTGQDVPARRRDLADVHRAAGRLPVGPADRWSRLRARAAGRPQRGLGLTRVGSVAAHPPGGSAGIGLRRPHHDPHRRHHALIPAPAGHSRSRSQRGDDVRKPGCSPGSLSRGHPVALSMRTVPLLIRDLDPQVRK